jgi:hypothetical protein
MATNDFPLIFKCAIVTSKNVIIHEFSALVVTKKRFLYDVKQRYVLDKDHKLVYFLYRRAKREEVLHYTGVPF